MITPQNRRDFERHMDILAEKIEKRTFSMAPIPRMVNSLLNVKKSPNGRLNLLTIDESARLMANSLANFDRPEFKNIEDAKK